MSPEEWAAFPQKEMGWMEERESISEKKHKEELAKISRICVTYIMYHISVEGSAPMMGQLLILVSFTP